MGLDAAFTKAYVLLSCSTGVFMTTMTLVTLSLLFTAGTVAAESRFLFDSTGHAATIVEPSAQGVPRFSSTAVATWARFSGHYQKGPFSTTFKTLVDQT